MNGRAYDYNLGRFLSVDPIIQFPANSQSLNPYSYLMNNPMSGSDPSGYISCDAAVQGKVKGGCTRGEDPSDPGSQWGKGKTIIGNYPGSGKSQSNGANQTASSASASTQVPEINSPSEAGKTNDPSAETYPYGPYPRFSVTRNLESYAIAGTEQDYRMVPPEVSFGIAAIAWLISGTNSFSGENAPGDDSIEGGAFSPLGVAKGVGAAAGSLVLRRGANTLPASAFHHTFDDAVDSIAKTGLSPRSYATPTTNLNPLQAHIELALPGNKPRNAIFSINLQSLRKDGYKIPEITRVSSFKGLPGGGFEMRFPYAIPPEYLTRVQ